MNRTGLMNPGDDQPRETTGLAGGKRQSGRRNLALGVGVILILWSGGWRCLDHWPWFRAHRAVVARQRVNVGAIFYTELEHYPGKPAP